MSTPGTVFVPEWADRVERFFAKVLVHTKGRWARVPFRLEDFQADDIIRPLFGTARWSDQLGDYVRAYNEAWLELARKNGKSELLAGIALYLLVGDGEESGEIYGAAADKDQAALVFNVAARMVELSPILSRRLDVIKSRRRIVDPVTNSVYQVVAADAAGNLGQDPTGIVFDEIISQPSRDLYDTFRTSLGGRVQPLIVCATTAGNNPESFAAHEHREARLCAEDPRRQPNRFVYIRNTPSRAPATGKGSRAWKTRGRIDEDGTAEVDPFDETNWHHANPALAAGFLNIEILRSEAAAAEADPTKENAFRQFRLNQWVSQATRALPLPVWDATAGMVVADKLEGRLAFAGLDLAATTDLAALALLFPPLDPEAPPTSPEGEIPVLWRYWVQQSAVPILDGATGGRISVWARQGFLTIQDGDVIDYDEIHEQLEADGQRFRLAELNLDIWNSASTAKWAENQGLDAHPVRQTFAALSPPTKELLRIIRTRQLRHGGNPVTRWNAEALELLRDRAENVRPVKPDRQKSGKRVDGMVALIMALDGYMRRGTVRRSAYEESGVRTV